MDEENKDLTPDVQSDPQPDPGAEHQPPPVRWATKKERIIAWVLAAIVIVITLAYIWSIYTGRLFLH